MVLATASAVFAAAATGSALAWNGVGTVTTAVRAASASPSADPTADPTSVRVTPDPKPTKAATTASAAPLVTASAAKPPAAKASTPSATKTAVATPSSTKAKASSSTRSSSSSSTRTEASRSVSSKGITISRYVDAPGSQKAINKCNLVLWSHKPLWLAAHNYCGYQWLAYVATGKTVVVTKGAAAGTYVVTGHLRLSRQSGAMPKVNADLVLQTCIGNGTGLTLLRRVS